ncbi:MAG TPA: hypothetical protein VN750_01085 [Steroidobacteraceae bacterium]|nr:hypothetical protein [Steroidobacteraceae bacterium]
MSITNCRACGHLFEAGEEYGNAPDRLCSDCWRRGVRLDCYGNRIRYTPEPIKLPPGVRQGADDKYKVVRRSLDALNEEIARS